MRTLKFPESYQTYDFLKASKTESDGKVRLRFLCMHHVQQGQQAKTLGPLLGVCRQTVSNWLSRLNEYGIEGLYDLSRSGAPTHLDRDKEEDFRAKVIQLQQEKEGGRIRGVDIQTLLKEQYDCEYSLDGVYQLLKRLGIVWITPRSMHPQADFGEQDAFKKNSEPN